MVSVSFADIKDHVGKVHQVQKSLITSAITCPNTSSLVAIICFCCNNNKDSRMWCSEREAYHHIDNIHGQIFRDKLLTATCRLCEKRGSLAEIQAHVVQCRMKMVFGNEEREEKGEKEESRSKSPESDSTYYRDPGSQSPLPQKRSPRDLRDLSSPPRYRSQTRSPHNYRVRSRSPRPYRDRFRSSSHYRSRSPRQYKSRTRSRSPPLHRHRSKTRSPRQYRYRSRSQISRHGRIRSRSPQYSPMSSRLLSPVDHSSENPTSYFCDACNIGPMGLQNYSYHLKGRVHASKLGPEALKRNEVKRAESSRLAYHKYQNSQSTKVIKKSQFGSKTCSMCSKHLESDHYHCRICNICTPGPESLEQHMTGRSHIERSQKKSNQRKHHVESSKERSPFSSKSSSRRDKESLSEFAWVRCKRMGCGFTGLGLEVDTLLRHQAQAHNWGGMDFFNIFCRICTLPDNVNQTSEVFDDASDFLSHMKQCHQEEHVNLLQMKNSEVLENVSNFVSHMRQQCHQKHVD